MRKKKKQDEVTEPVIVGDADAETTGKKKRRKIKIKVKVKRDAETGEVIKKRRGRKKKEEQQLRDDIVVVEDNRKLKKSLDYANKEGIKYVIIIGSNELETGNIIIKDMINGNNIETRINEIANLRLK